MLIEIELDLVIVENRLILKAEGVVEFNIRASSLIPYPFKALVSGIKTL